MEHKDSYLAYFKVGNRCRVDANKFFIGCLY